jgi:formate hydrogenlyase subunit 6/NADH:ubiquinone oxidoreductase subunit I
VTRAGDPRGGIAQYFAAIARSAKSVVEGMAVTFSYLFRAPTTVQYPDRLDAPLTETLPERYRGFLEVDMAACTACKACERDCPIDVIAIDLEKVEDKRVMTRFDIDLGKCMYCGICVESCPVEVQSPGDVEPTKVIRFTREFEGSTSAFSSLTFRFIKPGEQAIPFKPKKGEAVSSPRRGEIAREVRQHAREYNELAYRWALDAQTRQREVAELASAEPEASVEELLVPQELTARGETLRGALEAIERDQSSGFGGSAAVEALVVREALAGSDCQACGWPSCQEYARALVSGVDRETFKCEPGGARSTRDLTLLVQLRAGRPLPEAEAEAAAQVRLHHRGRPTP